MNAEIKPVLLTELYKTNFSIFADLTEVKRKNQIKKVSYLEEMARLLEVKLDDIDLRKVLKFSGNEIQNTQTDINKILAEFKREDFVEEVTEELSETNVKKIDELLKSRLGSGLRDLERTLESKKRDYTRFSEAVNKALFEISSATEKIRQAKDADYSEYQEMITKILEDKRFKLKSVNDDSIDFYIDEDIINTYKNPRLDVDLRVNLGRFLLRVTVNGGFSVKGLGAENNIVVSSYIHPHIGSDGKICLGNMQDLMNEAASNNDLFSMLDVAYQVLTNYYHENPYRPLDEFASKSRQIQPNGQIFEGELPQDEEDYDDEEWIGERMVSCYECETEYEIDFENEHY